MLLYAILMLCVVLPTRAVEVSDCIAEKFYRYNQGHTACVKKSAGAQTSGVSADDKKAIVDKHNEYRAIQSATDMEKMVWDDEIAAIAQRWTDNCVFDHDKDRRIPGRFSLGQNLAAGQANWASAVKAWYDEVSDFTYGTKEANVFSKVGHYTQLVWAKSAKIGCGYTHCTSLSYKHFYACNYGPSGNFDWSKPYKQGAKCADCAGKCVNNLCDCGGMVCENSGTLDLKTCKCTCSMDWHIPGHCALNCSAVVESKSCAPGGFYDGKCKQYSNVPDECPKTCNICPYADYKGDSSGDKDGNDGDKTDGKDDDKIEEKKDDEGGASERAQSLTLLALTFIVWLIK